MSESSKKTLFNIIKSIIFIAVLTCCILLAIMVLRRKDSQYKYGAFFDKAKNDQIDVLFIGSSHVINAINPVVLFDKYGISSYNMGGHGSVMQATYWELREALQYTRPKYVVVDTFLLQKDYQYLDLMYEDSDDSDRKSSIEQLHLNMDVWPLNSLKAEAIRDLIYDEDVQKEFLFDFLIYHGRWDELQKQDFEILGKDKETTHYFGAEMRYNVELTPGFYPDPEGGEGLEEPSIGLKYLEKIIELCQEEDIGIIVTFYPCSATTDDKRAANSAAELCESMDVPFVDMNSEEAVDLYTDRNDTGHLNAVGAIKVTSYIGRILSETGEFTDHRGDSAYKDFRSGAAYLYDEIKDMSVDDEDIYRKLHYLSVGTVGSVIYINDGSEALEDPEIKRLIENISGTPLINDTQGPYILINDPASGRKYEADGRNTIDGAETAFGTLHYQPVEHMFRIMYAEGDEDNNFLYDDNRLQYDIQIITFDREDGEELSHQYFRSYGSNYEQ